MIPHFPLQILRCAVCSIALAGLVFVLPQTALAQTSTAAINGTIQDATGAVIPEAEIVLTNVETGVERRTLSNTVGNYVILHIPPGSYVIDVTREGFSVARDDEVNLEVNQTATYNFTLAVGATTETITVEAVGAEIESSTSELGTVIGNQEVVDLPLNGRNFTQLITLTPGVSPVSVAQNRGGFGTNPVGSFSFPSINGQINRSNVFTLDGINNVGSHVNTYAVAPIVDAIQEFKVQSHNDQAEFGGGVGGVINVVTKSGTNEVHGTAWEFLRNDALDARNPFFRTVTPFRQNQFGATIGGPIAKNRTFFFGSYQGFRSTRDSESLLRVPTDANLRGDLSDLGANIFDPFTTREDPNNSGQFLRDQYPNNTVPQGGLNSGMVAYAQQFFPAAESTGVPGKNNIDNTPRKNDQDEWTVKVDHQLGQNKSLMFRFNQTRHPISASAGFEGLVRTEDLDSSNYGVNYVHTISPTAVLQLQFGRSFSDYARLFQFESAPPSAEPQSILTQVGFSTNFACGFKNGEGVEECFIPGMRIPGFLGGTTQRTAITFSDLHQWKGSFSKIVRNHTFKMGAEFNSMGNSSGGPRQNASVSFAAQQTGDPLTPGTGNALASFLVGVPNSAGRRNAFETLHGGWVNGFYFQDTWRVTDKLTFNWGLRFDYTLIPVYGSPEDNNDEVGDMDLINGQYILKRHVPSCEERGQAPCIPGGLESQEHVIVDPRGKIYHNTFDNFQPRVGIAYRLAQNSALRVSYGIYFDNWAGFSQIAQNYEGSWPSVEQLLANNLNLPGAGKTVPTRTPQDPFDLGTGAVFPAPTPFNQVLWFADPHFKNAYSQQWNLGLQHQLTGNTIVEANYVGSATSRNNLGGYYNVAQTPGPGNPRERSLFPYIAPTFFDRSWGRSNYHAFQFRLDRRFSNGLSYLVSYTWSKSIDTACSGFFGVEGCATQDPYNFNNDRSVSGHDLPHILNLSWVYRLPFGKRARFSSGNAVLDQLIGNWQFNGIAQFTSGIPYHLGVSGDIANTGNVGRPSGGGGGSFYERLNVVGDHKLSSPTPAGWFNRDAFAVPARYTFGNLGRHSLRGDGFANFDVSLFRQFPISEGRMVEFRTEFFNVTNSPTWGLPIANFNNRNFGRVFGTRSRERQIQFGLKVIF